MGSVKTYYTDENGKLRDRNWFKERHKTALKQKNPGMKEEELEFYSNLFTDQEIEEIMTDYNLSKKGLCPLITSPWNDNIYITDKRKYTKELLSLTIPDRIEFLKNLINQINRKIKSLNTFRKKNPASCEECNYKNWCKNNFKPLERIKIIRKTAKEDLDNLGIETQIFEGNQGQAKKKRETWTDQEKKKYIEEFIEFRDSKAGKSLEGIKSLWDRHIVSKSESRIPKASALKSWIEDGKYTMTSIKKENIPDLRIFAKD